MLFIRFCFLMEGRNCRPVRIDMKRVDDRGEDETKKSFGLLYVGGIRR